jgi:hypothetical protein
MSAGTVEGGSESDDGSSLTIEGGIIGLSVSGGDGIDSNGSFSMKGGSLYVNGPSPAESNVDVGIDVNGSFAIYGGTVVALAEYSQSMTIAPGSSSTQASVLVGLSSAQSAGSIFHIQDSSGNDILSFKPAKAYQSVIYSSSALSVGSTYSFYYGGSYSGSVDSYGLCSGGTYVAGTLYKTQSLSSLVTTIASSSSSGSGGSAGPGGRN